MAKQRVPQDLSLTVAAPQVWTWLTEALKHADKHEGGAVRFIVCLEARIEAGGGWTLAPVSA